MAASATPTKTLSNGMGRNFLSISQAIPWPDCIYNLVMVADTAQAITPPKGAKWALIAVSKATATDDLWINPNGTAAVPAANVLDGTGSTLVPNGFLQLSVDGVTALSCVSHTTPKVSISWYLDGTTTPIVQPNAPY